MCQQGGFTNETTMCVSHVELSSHNFVMVDVSLLQTSAIWKFANPIVPGKINLLQSTEVMQEAKL